MFALLIPSRPLVASPTATLSQTQCSFTVSSSPSFAHLALFLHPGQALPDDTLAAIYIQLPSSTDFKLLGALSMQKQSALFRVNAGKASVDTSSLETREEIMTDDTAMPNVAQEYTSQSAGDVVVGISIEPAPQIQPQLDTLRQSFAQDSDTIHPPPTPDSRTLSPQANLPGQDQIKALAQRIGQNAFNFLSSFTEKDATGKEMVPMRAFENWWGKFEKKIGIDASFLLRGSADQP